MCLSPSVCCQVCVPAAGVYTNLAASVNTMTWLALLTFAVISLAVAAFVSALVANLEPQPEYPTVMTDTIRVIGGLIAVAAGVFGAILLGYAAGSYLGW